MGLRDALSRFLAIEPMHELSAPWTDLPDLEAQFAALRLRGVARPWRVTSIAEALGVPAIQRAVTLISNTTGMLAIQGYRNGVPMDEAPRLILRPDPFSTPREFYRDSAYNMATRGQAVWWIASRDSDGWPSALIVVPLGELTIEESRRNRLFPTYRWGDRESTRFSPASRSGEFVHLTYLREPGALHGVGPLQLAIAAASVSVHAQEWAANFYADGGTPSTLIRSAVEVDEAEALALKTQWTSSPSNVPRVVDPGIEEVKQFNVDPAGAQMLSARDFQTGEAARMFGIPGSLLDFGGSGSSITYQTVAEEYVKFVRTCLLPNYLEPIAQAMSDLLPRSIVVQFFTAGLEKADIKTRFEVYASGIGSGVLSVELAQQMEGILAGSPENAAIPPTPPAAVPSSVPKVLAGPVRCERCNRLLAELATPPFRFTCPKCKAVQAVDVTGEARADDSALAELAIAITALASREQPVPVVTVHPASITVEAPAPAQVTIAEGAIQLNVPPPADVRMDAPITKVYQAGTEADTELAARMATTLDAIETELKRPKIVDKEVVRDADGRIVGVRETEMKTPEEAPIDG